MRQLRRPSDLMKEDLTILLELAVPLLIVRKIVSAELILPIVGELVIDNFDRRTLNDGQERQASVTTAGH
jgi:hypothetical protein